MSYVNKKRVFIGIILLTIVFIWGQSCLSREVSAAESDVIKSWLKIIFKSETPFSIFLLKYIRKIAHFIEFGMLGTEMTLFTVFFTRCSPNNKIHCVLFGFAVASMDETIQKFTGRGSSFYDIILDFCGYLTFTLITVGVCFLIKRLKKGNTKNV